MSDHGDSHDPTSFRFADGRPSKSHAGFASTTGGGGRGVFASAHEPSIHEALAALINTGLEPRAALSTLLGQEAPTPEGLEALRPFGLEDAKRREDLGARLALKFMTGEGQIRILTGLIAGV